MKILQKLSAIALALLLMVCQAPAAMAGPTVSWNPGNQGSNPHNGLVHNGAVYFLADDGVGNGDQIFRRSGGVTVKVPGQSFKNVHDLVAINGVLAFAATTDATGDEVYFTDGPVNSFYLQDLRPGADSSSPSLFTAFGPTGSTIQSLVFRGGLTNGADRAYIWSAGAAAPLPMSFIFDGTKFAERPTEFKATTQIRGDQTFHQLLVAATYTGDAKPSLLSVGLTEDGGVNSRFFDVLGRQVDPTGITVKPSVPGAMFSGFDGLGREPWYTNGVGVGSTGTTPGTTRVGDINPGAISSDPTNFTWMANNEVIFSAQPATGPRRPYRTNAGQIVQVSTAVENPGSFFVDGTNLYFSGFSSTEGQELWSSNNNALTVSSTNINPDSGSVRSSSPHGFTKAGSAIYFGARRTDPGNATGTELYRITSNVLSPTLVNDINPGADSSEPRIFAVEGSTIHLSAYTNTIDAEPYQALANGQSILTGDLNQFLRPQPVSDSVTLDNGLTIAAIADAQYGLEPRVISGSTQTLLKDIVPGGIGSDIRGLTKVGNTAYFVAVEDGAVRLWQTDGTVTGTAKVALPSGLGTNFQSSLDVVKTDGGAIYYSGSSSTGSHILRVGATVPALTKPLAVPIMNLTGGFSGGVFYNSGTVTEPLNLEPEFLTDSGVVYRFEVRPGPEGSGARSFIAGNGFNFFVADDGVHGSELFRQSGGVVALIKDINPGAEGSNILELVRADSRIYFAAYSSAFKEEGSNVDGGSAKALRIWRTKEDATDAFTMLGTDINAPLSPPAYVWNGAGQASGDRSFSLISDTYTDYSTLTKVRTGVADIAFYVSARFNLNRPGLPSDCYPTGAKSRFIYGLPPKALQDSLLYPFITGSQSSAQAFQNAAPISSRALVAPLEDTNICGTAGIGYVGQWYDPALFLDEVELVASGNFLYIAGQTSAGLKVLKFDATQSLVNPNGNLNDYKLLTTVFPLTPGLTTDNTALMTSGSKVFLGRNVGGNFVLEDVT